MSQNYKVIGNVLSVDNFHIFAKIDETLKGAYKSGVNDIYEIARINSYLIIPVGADRIVALITRVTMKEDIDFERSVTGIVLPTSTRYISATMIGTIVGDPGDEHFIQGVYNFPALDSPIWYVTERDLELIFDNNENILNFSKCYYLPIGTSPMFTSYNIKICPDQLFAKHAAILGNTGSGKSCTVTSILRSIFKYRYNGEYLKSAHFIIFDTNGEYKSAFIPNEQSLYELNDDEKSEIKRINAYYYGGETYPKVPYWFMNWEDIKAFLKPSDGTQAPVLNRAIGLAKNELSEDKKEHLTLRMRSNIESIINYNNEELKKRTGFSRYSNWEWKKENEIYSIGVSVSRLHKELGAKIMELANETNFNNASKQEPIIQNISEIYNTIVEDESKQHILNIQNIDLPTWFDYKALCSTYIDAAIRLESDNTRISEFVATLKLRMRSFLNDVRIAVPLMLKNNETINKEILPQFIALILGNYSQIFKDEDNHFVEKYDNEQKNVNKERASQVSIIDLSALPIEVIETITALLGRIIFEFVTNFKIRGSHPIVIILEEAQNYIAEKRDSLSKDVFEKIAREGRKYGISLLVCSQRPSELSKTVLSQCNSFIIHRIQNPDDQKYVRGLISSANADLLDQLPIIPQQHAIITGDCVRAPIQARINNVYPTPNSHNPLYIETWLREDHDIDYKGTCDRWLKNK